MRSALYERPIGPLPARRVASASRPTVTLPDPSLALLILRTGHGGLSLLLLGGAWALAVEPAFSFASALVLVRQFHRQSRRVRQLLARKGQ